ncbi:hypothetical protein HRH25_23475 [Flavisolibacter sp. BT320]|nr:hypothetical protein [Flavisolibacter longurius]
MPREKVLVHKSTDQLSRCFGLVVGSFVLLTAGLFSLKLTLKIANGDKGVNDRTYDRA